MPEPEKLINQGAEAKLYLSEYNGTKCLVKERFQKNYRHPELDAQLTKERMRSESKTVGRCEKAGIRCPKIYHMDLKSRKIYMEHFPETVTVKEYINQILTEQNRTEIFQRLAKQIGLNVARMHSGNIIHGDLTTSNLLIDPNGQDQELIVIDFGLSHYSGSSEDKGVDLYVLERALLSSHPNIAETFFDQIMETYREENSSKCVEIINKFEEVRSRGRKRLMVG